MNIISMLLKLLIGSLIWGLKAVLGAKVRAPTPEGEVQVTIAPGSNSGKLLRLKGRGAFAQGRRGDLLARIVVTLPETPDAALIKFAEDWRAKRPYTPGR